MATYQAATQRLIESDHGSDLSFLRLLFVLDVIIVIRGPRGTGRVRDQRGIATNAGLIEREKREVARGRAR